MSETAASAQEAAPGPQPQGYDADWLNSDLEQKERERVMARTREGKLRFLVATDVAARGIDISDLAYVINYTTSDSPEVYVHRTGRTGRAGKSGIARTTPLVYFEDRGRYVVVGSDGAARNDPQWWKNLKVNPSATVRVGRDKFPATASLATGDERARLWERGGDVNPMWKRYQTRTERELPVVILTRR